MSREEIMAAVKAAVTQVQEMSERDVPPLREDTRIIGDVPGCDSIATVEITIVLTDILSPVLNGKEIPEDILIGKNSTARPTLNEIATAISDFINQPKAPCLRLVGSSDGSIPEPSSGDEARFSLKDGCNILVAARATNLPRVLVSTSSSSSSSSSQLPPPLNEGEGENPAKDEIQHDQ
jgi:hypothetical protein